MKKEIYRDYATAAFRRWAELGCPDYDKAVEMIRKKAIMRAGNINPEKAIEYADAEVDKQSALLCDILACSQCFEMLGKRKKYICDAVKEVYMSQAEKGLKRKEITYRVTRYSIDNNISESQIYRWLHEARALFAGLRGLNIGDDSV